MADNEFITLEEEEDELTSEDLKIDDSSKKDIPKSNPIILYIIIALLALLLIAGGIFFYLYLSKKDEKKTKDISATQIIQNLNENKLTQTELSRAGKLIQKADRLYKNGQKKEAIKIYEDLSLYNKALSYYNIGVAHLKDEKYKKAILSFDKAMSNKALKTPSAINACVCGIHLKDQNIFKHYLTAAKRSLPYLLNSPLYSYYLSLIHYYYSQPLESLVVLQNPTSNFYMNEQKYISSKIFSAFKNDKQAISSILSINNPKNALTLGLLRAKLGEYSLAVNSLQSAITQDIEPLKANIALSLVKNKMGMLGDAGDILEGAFKNNREKSIEVYPITVELKESLFDPKVAQREFKNKIFLNDRYKYSLLFYYAPYHMSNQNHTISKITKGSKKIAIQSLKPAVSYLEDSKAISKINISITKALEKIRKNQIYDAIEILEKSKSLYPTHSTIYYNLALSYAQIFNFKKAYEYFSKSYSLDKHNYYALTFKALCAKLTSKEAPSKDLERLKLNTKDKNALALIEIARNSLGLEIGVLKDTRDPFISVINLLFAFKQNNLTQYQLSAKEIKKSTNSDIVSNIIYLDAINDKTDIKEYSKTIQTTLIDNNLNKTTLYNGGFLAKELYVQMHNIAGISHILDIEIEYYIKDQKPNISMLQLSALSNIYNQDFNDAYNTYNTLIDEYNQKDSHTLFLASIAAIGSNHNANAVALLELSKLTDSSYLESKYALGLLYHEATNLEAAAIQYKKIGNINFKSNYFKFKLTK